MQALSGRVASRDRVRDEVLGLIRAAGALTRAEIVTATGLSSSTVQHALDKLVDSGRVGRTRPAGKGPGSGSGRPGVVFSPLPSGRIVAGVDFGHGHTRVAIANDIGEPIDEVTLRLDVDLNAFQALDAAAEQLGQLQRAHDVAELAAVVAGIPGPVDKATGIVCSPTILSGWVGLDPARELRDRLGTPVHIENDATLGALGEYTRGAGRSHPDLVYVKASGGIGAGLVINGVSYTGATGLAGEIGHTLIPGRSEMCRCGRRGCLEAVISVTSVREQILHAHPGASPEAAIAEAGDPVTGRILDEAGRTLGRTLADLCNLVNPSAVIIGGELGASGPSLVQGVSASINRYAQPETAASLVVVPAQLGVRSELVGALQLASQLVF